MKHVKVAWYAIKTLILIAFGIGFAYSLGQQMAGLY